MTSRPERILVVGLGAAGQAALRALAARGIEAYAVEDRPTEVHRRLTGDLGVPLVVAPDPSTLATLARDATAFLPAPGLPERHPAFAAAAAAGLPTISEFDLAHRWDQRPIVAITGTNGKTTVTMMVTAMLEASGRRAMAVGNTEIPLVAALDDPAVEVFVVEASSFRLGHSRFFRPDVATWLNFAPDHLDVHRDLATYEAAKARIWADQGVEDVAVGNAEDPIVAEHLARAGAQRLSFGLQRGDYRIVDGSLVTDDLIVIAAVDELPRSLPHDLQNALAASATALASGATFEAVSGVLRTWQHLPHRVQLVGERAGVRFYDDSKATTPHATLAALSGFEQVVLIAGGQNKGIDLRPLAAPIDRIRAVVAIGAAAEEIADAFAGRREVVVATSMDDAVAAAASLASAGDAVLLSPACASFDWYRNYGERGDDFARAVRALLASGSGGTATGGSASSGGAGGAPDAAGSRGEAERGNGA